MGAGNFFAGLLGGYTGTVIQNEDRAYKQEMAARELDVKSSLQALDEAVKTGDQGSIQAATANFQRAMNSVRDPFHYQMGGGKGKGKKQQGQENPFISKVLQAFGQHGVQQKAQQGQQPMSEQIPAGPMAGQPAQGAGLGAVPTLASRTSQGTPVGNAPSPQVQSQAPQTGNQPQQGQGALPAPPSLASVYAKYPDLQTQAATQGQASGTEINKLAEGIINWQEGQGTKLGPEEKAQIQERVAKIEPRATGVKPTLMTPKAPVTAGEVASGSSNAVLPDGRPLSAIDPKQPVNLWQFPDGKVVAFPASATPANAGTISGQEAKAVEETIGTTNPDTGKPFTRVEAISKVRHAMAANAAGGRAIPTKTLIVGGKPHVMGWDDKTQKYDLDMGIGPSSTGYPRVVNINDDKGNTTGAYVIRAQPNGGTSVSQVNFERPIPPKPTAAVLTQGQRSAMIQPQVAATIALVHQTAGKLGWASGRWNDTVTKFGANNPDIAALQMKLQLFSTALMLAHGLRGENYEKNLSAYLNAAQSPDNLVARIQSADDYLNDYAAAVGKGKPNSESGMVRVSVPGHPPGQIPKSQLKAFKEKYPNASVIQ